MGKQYPSYTSTRHTPVPVIHQYPSYTSTRHTPVPVIHQYPSYTSTRHTPVPVIHQYPSYTSTRHFCALLTFRQITRPEARCLDIISSSLSVDDCLQTMHNLKPLYFITSALKVYIHCIGRHGTSLLQDNCHFHLFR